MQWDLSIVDTIARQLHVVGTADSVLIREVPFIQKCICTQLYVVETADSVLIREVSLIQCPL